VGDDEVKADASRVHSFVQTSRLIEGYRYYLIGLMVFAFSFFIHSRCSFCPAEYSDIYSLFFQVFEFGERWFTGAAASLGLPYVDYRFEYPPVIACLFYASSVVSLDLARWTSVTRDTSFYIVFTLAFLLPAYMFYLKAVNDTSNLLNARWSRLLFAVAGFGISYYVVYNFDIIAIAFAMFSLLLLIRGNARSAGVLLALSVASKVVTGVILLPSLLYLARRSIRLAVSYFLCFLLTMGATFGPVYVLARTGLEEMFKWHAAWYCENCFYVMIANDIYSESWRLVSQALMVIIPIAVMLATRHANEERTLVRRSLLMVPAIISVSWVYSPQMNVMIAPAYLLAAGPLAFGLLALSDFLNVLIMFFFFRPEMVCSLFRIWECPGVWWRESPIQWIAFSRIVLLWVFMVACIISSKSKVRISRFLRTSDAWLAKNTSSESRGR